MISTNHSERRSAVRAEVSGELGPVTLHLGGWYAAVRGYLVDSNPAWAPVVSFYAPRTPPGTDANVAGAYAQGRLKQLEDENRRLKQMVADLTLDRHMLQEVIRKKL